MYSEVSTALRTLLSKKISWEFGRVSRAEESFMTSVSARDFLNYVKVEQGFLYDNQAPEERAIYYIEDLIERKPFLLSSILDDWFTVWAMKWKQRVKLASDKDVDEELVKRIEQETKLFIGLPVFEEAKRFALGSLVKNGEVCFTDTLSEVVVKNTLFSMVVRAGSSEDVRKTLDRNPIFLLNEISKRVKMLSKFKGPLVALKFERVIFSEEPWFMK
ncbi:MAG: hypothetical protein NZ954_02430 [Thermofilaceae archaeon]|nr:hypothetical protein [Thermofilaceae archaeon]MDW8003531.1 hypothetical protein [Thermofilaceae archaeon]